MTPKNIKQNEIEKEIEDCLRLIYKKQLRSLLIQTADKNILGAIRLAFEKGKASKEKDVLKIIGEILDIIKKQKWDKNEDATTNQIATKMVEYSGGINSVIDRHNKSLEEIKKELKKRLE